MHRKGKILPSTQNPQNLSFLIVIYNMTDIQANGKLQVKLIYESPFSICCIIDVQKDYT